MKKIKMFAISLVAIMAGVINVNAATIEVDTADELLEAITANADIKLIKDIDFGGFTGNKVVIAVGTEINLDLNGYTISGESTNEKISTALIQNNGTLTIKDSSTNGTGKITLSDNNVRAYTWGTGIFTINNMGTLVINGGTIENTGGTDVPYAIDNNSGNRNTSVTINGGKVVAKVAAIRAFCNSTTYENNIIINGGEITAGSSAVWISQVNKRANNGYLEVNGGTIYGEKSNGIYVSVFDQSLMSNMAVKFTGGTIKNNSETSATFMYEPWSSDSDLANAVLNLDITGGTFINENAQGPAFHQYPEIEVTYTNISGGTFSSDVTKHVADGYVSKLVNGNYVVAVEKAINVTSVENGTVTVDKTKAIIGEEVTITVTPNEGYEITTLKVVDADNKEITIENNKFVMPNGEVTVTATLTKVETTVSLPVVDTEAEVEEVVVGVKESEELEDILIESLTESLKDEEQKDLAEALTNSSTVVEVEILKEKEEDLKPLLVEEMQKVAGKATIATYFDIAVVVKKASNGDYLGAVPELTKEIELMILLPEELKNTDEKNNRTYYVIRQHDEEIEKLPATLSEDGNSLVFKSDKFSTYALAYEDVANEVPENSITNEVTESPKTLDNAGLYIILGSLSLVALSVIAIYRKKRYN